MDEQPTFPPPPLSAEAAESLERGIEWMQEHPVAAEIAHQRRSESVREAERYLRRKRRGRKCEQPEGIDKHDLLIAGYRLKESDTRRKAAFDRVSKWVLFLGGIAAIATFFLTLAMFLGGK